MSIASGRRHKIQVSISWVAKTSLAMAHITTNLQGELSHTGRKILVRKRSRLKSLARKNLRQATKQAAFSSDPTVLEIIEAIRLQTEKLFILATAGNLAAANDALTQQKALIDSARSVIHNSRGRHERRDGAGAASLKEGGLTGLPTFGAAP